MGDAAGGYPRLGDCDGLQAFNETGRDRRSLVGAISSRGQRRCRQQDRDLHGRVLEKRHGVPFYVACPLSTIDPSMATGAEFQSRNAKRRNCWDSVGTLDTRRDWGPQSGFRCDPGGMVTAIITERGIARSPYDRSIADCCSEPTTGKQLRAEPVCFPRSARISAIVHSSPW